MANKVNIDKIKAEIDSKRKEKLGETGGVAPRDKFLNELMVSLKTGMETESTNLIKNVDNTTAQKLGETTKLKTSPVISSNDGRKPIPKPSETIEMSPEREEQMWQEFQKSKKQTLAESIQGFSNQGMNQQYPQQQYQQPPQQAPMLNEEHILGAVKSTVDGYLKENFGLVVEDAIKSTILEMYATERIKEVLFENKDLIRSAVKEVIREIQERNKQKKTQ